LGERAEEKKRCGGGLQGKLKEERVPTINRAREDDNINKMFSTTGARGGPEENDKTDSVLQKVKEKGATGDRGGSPEKNSQSKFVGGGEKNLCG